MLDLSPEDFRQYAATAAAMRVVFPIRRRVSNLAGKLRKA
jgi:hypothetical protein